MKNEFETMGIAGVIMKRSIVSFVMLLMILYVYIPSVIIAQDDLPDIPPGAITPIDPEFDLPLTRGLALVYSDRFQEAIAYFDSLQLVYPDHPAPYFYMAATYQSWMASFRVGLFQKELEENVQKAIDLGNALKKVQPDDPWLNFYVGGAYGYRAFFKFRRFNWIGAYLDGKKGIIAAITTAR